ncbi:hypothetical protein PCL_12522 [Purpureocillium lilacinum]|uniref:Uncharacterized protein n=1 Tax=Purpureocillium lilacinum TaxID=33203 RepID=A0A2U3E9G7_PURLI|nr:hypothetical protein Purlil1_10465 [Purpureocillium lilacinum]PWI71154.1 hypothetical protein PCL_12522 [Purpureocillium lilacinum]
MAPDFPELDPSTRYGTAEATLTPNNVMLEDGGCLAVEAVGSRLDTDTRQADRAMSLFGRNSFVSKQGSILITAEGRWKWQQARLRGVGIFRASEAATEAAVNATVSPGLPVDDGDRLPSLHHASAGADCRASAPDLGLSTANTLGGSGWGRPTELFSTWKVDALDTRSWSLGADRRRPNWPDFAAITFVARKVTTPPRLAGETGET